jgi:hypothetical protein
MKSPPNLHLLLLGSMLALTDARAQHATVAGDVVLRDGGAPLGFITVSLLAQDKQFLTGATGTFLLRDLPPGEVRLRFRRIGFVPKDTTLTLAPGDTARIHIAMTQLAIQLPEVAVSGRCANETPFEPKPPFMAQLFDQVSQNAQRMVLLAQVRPFVVSWAKVGVLRAADKPDVQIESSAETHGPLPDEPYKPGRVTRRITYNGRPAWGVFPPDLSDFADTTFTNSHCFHYAGQRRFETDSVIAVDFEPVPRLARVMDIAGTLYLRVEGYQLVGLEMHVTPLRDAFSHLQAYTHRSVFTEVAPGVPIATEYVLMNVFRNGRPSFVQTSRVVELRWSDQVTSDTMRSR